MPAARCRLCDSAAVLPVLDLGDSRYAHRFVRPADAALPEPHAPLELAVCQDCGHVQLAHELALDSLWDGSPRFPDERAVADRVSQELAEAILRRHSVQSRDLVVEVCADHPPVLTAFWRRGCRVLAVDPLPMPSLRPKARGLESLRETFDESLARDLRSQFGPAQMLIVNDVLPYLPRPVEFLRGTRRLLAENGAAVLEMPHPHTLVRSLEFDRILHERANYFSLHTLERTLEPLGLRVMDADTQAYTRGVLRVWLALSESAHTVTPRVVQLRKQEAGLQLQTQRTWRVFSQRVRQAQERIQAQLARAQRDGHRLAGYGMSNRCAALLMSCSVSLSQVSFVVDPNPLRQGFLTPGLHLPILTPSRLAVSQPEEVIILNGETPQTLEARHPEYVHCGGRFVDSLPKSRVLECAA